MLAGVRVALDQDLNVAVVVEVVVSGEANVRRDDNNSILIDEIKKNIMYFSKCFFKSNLFLNYLLHIVQSSILYDFPCAKLVFKMAIPSFVINGQAYHLEIEKE